MRYIKKLDEPNCIADYKAIQQQAGLSFRYSSFKKKKILNAILRAEQHHICCYCQQKITCYQENKISGAHNEHLDPQAGDPGDGSIDLDYNNIYACCIASTGMSKLHQHCGEAKHHNYINGLIRRPICNTYFKYNLLGEILPNGEYSTWEEYDLHKTLLTGFVTEAYEEIKVLNLNCNKLKSDRRGDLDKIIHWINLSEKQDIEQKIIEFENSEYYERGIDMLLYFMKKKI